MKSFCKIEKIKAAAKEEVLERILADAKKHNVSVAFCAEIELKLAKTTLDVLKKIESERND